MKSRPCSDCGRAFPPEAMDFDHVRGEKSSGVARIANYSKNRIMQELEKCELVCACCHRLSTEKRRTRK